MSGLYPTLTLTLTLQIFIFSALAALNMLIVLQYVMSVFYISHTQLEAVKEVYKCLFYKREARNDVNRVLEITLFG